MAPPRKPKVQPASEPSRTLVLDNGAYTIKAGFVMPGATAISSNDASFDEIGTDHGTNGAANHQIQQQQQQQQREEPRLIPNCITRASDRKTYVGSELSLCRDFGEMAFRRPMEKGYIVSWEAQREIWDREFFDDTALTKCDDPSETRLILAEHAGALPILQTNCDQMVFEEFGFASYYRGNGAAFNAWSYAPNHNGDGGNGQGTESATTTSSTTNNAAPAEIMMVIDSGYSHTTVTPLLKGRPLHQSVRRLDVGGKFLTNYLTRLLSLRHYDMRNDTYIVNEMKEAACYVSQDFKSDLEKTWKGTRGDPPRQAYLTGGGIAKDYVLPDFHTRMRGVVRNYDPSQTTRSRKLAAQLGEASEDVLTLRNERFAIPEILFNPSDVGLQQPGVADIVWQSLQTLPVGLWQGLLVNIVVVGGNTLFEGFVERLQEEIVQRVPDECVVRVHCPENPLTSTWHGAAQLARQEHVIKRLAVTKQEYDEHGAAWVARKFSTPLEP